jgi:hypothetical protein
MSPRYQRIFADAGVTRTLSAHAINDEIQVHNGEIAKVDQWNRGRRVGTLFGGSGAELVLNRHFTTEPAGLI